MNFRGIGVAAGTGDPVPTLREAHDGEILQGHRFPGLAVFA